MFLVAKRGCTACRERNTRWRAASPTSGSIKLWTALTIERQFFMA